MNIPLRIKHAILLLTIVLLMLSWFGVYLLLRYQLNNSVESQFQKISNSASSLFEINMQHDKKALEIKLNNIVAADGLSKAIAEKDHEAIKSIITPRYAELKKSEEAVNILTFRSPEGVTLFRAHKPEYFGDYLSTRRKLILDTNTLERPFSGFEVGKLEMTYRITKPIFYENNYVGNVELGMTPINFLKDLNAILNTDVGIVIEKSLIEIMLDKKVISVDDKYFLIRASDNLKAHYMHRHDEAVESYKISMNIPLKNHLSETLGYLLVGYDISTMVQEDRRFMYRMLFMISIMMLLLVLSLNLGFNKLLKYVTKQLYTDHLTGLQNRYAINDLISHRKNNVVILSNIKEFSLLNEFYGVDIANRVLIKVAEAFKSFALENGYRVYRVSSDEFVLLKQDDNFDKCECIEIVEKMHNKINTLNILVEGTDEIIHVEIYTGIAFDNANSLENAQMVLKKARNQSLSYLMYSQKVDTKKYSEQVIKVKKKIRYALEHNNIVPYFQPITNREEEIIKYEALVRIAEFTHGEKNILTPDQFLDISMQSNLYIKIAKAMIEQSLSMFANRDEKISVNFLPNDFFNSSIMDSFMKGIENFDCPEKIVVEITEQDSVDDFDKLLIVVDKLRQIGVLIAIDDFGSGYANYAHILKIKPDYLKIDGSLIQNILVDTESKILVKSIIRFAQELNITTIAEYVENVEIFELLKEYGVDEFQGYYFGKPMDLSSK